MPLPKHIHLDAVLTNISTAVVNTELVAPMVWPIVPVAKDSDVYYEYDRSNLRADDDEWAPKTKANEINWKTTRTAYKVERRALSELVEDDEVQNQDTPLNVMSDTTAIIAEKMMIRREKRLAAELQDLTNYLAGSQPALAVADRWDNFSSSTSDPADDVSTARSTIYSQTGRVPNIMVIPREVYEKLREHPLVVDRIKYTQTGVVTAELLAGLFDIERVVIAGAIENTANEEQADSLSFIWGKRVYFGWVTASASLRQPSWGYHIQSQAMLTERWRDEERKGEMIRTSYKDTPKLVTKGAGYTILTVIS